MVCIPCIVIPIALWVFHKFIQPFILKFWNPWAKKSTIISNDSVTGSEKELPICADSDMTDSPSNKHIQQMIKTHKVMVFSKVTCGFCDSAKALLDEVGVNYAVEQIDKRPDCRLMQDIFEKTTGERTVPRVYIDGKCIGGYDETYELHSQGKLLPLLKSSGATFKKLV